MRTIIIEMPLIKDLSVNHYLGKRKGGGFYVKKSVKEWQEELGWLIKSHHVEDWNLPLKVTCDVVQDDKRTRDISNFSKVVLDAIEELTGINDTNFRWQDGSILYTEDDPKLVIEITENAD